MVALAAQPRSSGMQRLSFEDDWIQDLLRWLTSYESFTEFKNNIAGIVEVTINEEISVTSGLLGATEGSIDSAEVAAGWIRSLETHIRGINRTTQVLVREQIIEGIKAGENLRDIAKRIESVFDYSGKVRSFVIARTEVLGASNYAAFSVYDRLGVPYKGWVTTMDGRQRDTHGDANGQIRPLAEPFDIGDSQLMYPGDPTGSAREVINCRCTIVPEYSANGEGRSLWNDETLTAWWDAYFARSRRGEILLKDACHIVFMSQRARCLNFLKLKAV
jgi:uncharacterized protein with gpF-like domain